jgi:hypothetical protein
LHSELAIDAVFPASHNEQVFAPASENFPGMHSTENSIDYDHEDVSLCSVCGVTEHFSVENCSNNYNKK